MPRKTNAELISNLRKFASFEGGHFVLPGHAPTDAAADTAAVMEATKLYRETWLMPALGEIEARLCKPRTPEKP